MTDNFRPRNSNFFIKMKNRTSNVSFHSGSTVFFIVFVLKVAAPTARAERMPGLTFLDLQSRNDWRNVSSRLKTKWNRCRLALDAHTKHQTEKMTTKLTFHDAVRVRLAASKSDIFFFEIVSTSDTNANHALREKDITRWDWARLCNKIASNTRWQ